MSELRAAELSTAYPQQQNDLKRIIETMCQTIVTKAPEYAVSGDTWPEIALKPTRKPRNIDTK